MFRRDKCFIPITIRENAYENPGFGHSRGRHVAARRRRRGRPAAAAPAPNPLDVVPDKMPFATPYGPPVSAQRAEALIQAATAEATKHGWPLNIAVVDSGGNLVAFLRMDGRC